MDRDDHIIHLEEDVCSMMSRQRWYLSVYILRGGIGSRMRYEFTHIHANVDICGNIEVGSILLFAIVYQGLQFVDGFFDKSTCAGM
jgi:hypothetical protein